MKKAPKRPQRRDRLGEMRPEYRLDYRRSRPNRFASGLAADTVTVTLDPDVAAVFDTAEAVNNLLRSVIAAIPGRVRAPRRSPRRKRASAKQAGLKA